MMESNKLYLVLKGCVKSAKDSPQFMFWYLVLSVTSHITCIVARCLINIVYLMAYAYQVMMTLPFGLTSLMTLNQHKNRKLRHNR